VTGINLAKSISEDKNNVVTVITNTATNFISGTPIAITTANYNGTYTIATVSTDQTKITYTDGLHSGLTQSSGGLAYQGIAVPSSTGKGIPVTLYNATNVTDVTFSLLYNPNLLAVPAGIGGSGTDATYSGSSFSWVSTTGIDSTHSLANFHYSFATQESGTIVLGDIVAYVPNTAASSYDAKALLKLGNIVINGVNSRNTRAVAAYTIGVNTYFGDVTGDGAITGADVSAETNVANGNATGFTAFPLTNPVIIGDVQGDLSIDSADVTDLRNYVNLLAHPQVPNVPPGLTISYAPSTADVNLLSNPGNQNNLVGDNVGMRLAFTESSTNAVTIAASGLPAGVNLASAFSIASSSGATESGSTVTITTTSAHGYAPGTSVFISGVGVAGYNGWATIASVTSKTFTYTSNSTGLAASGGGSVTSALITGGPTTPGTYSATVTVNDTISTATQTFRWTVGAIPGAATQFVVTPVTTSVPKGSPLTFMVAALDGNNQLAASYSGTVQITSSDSGATLPPSAPLTGGMGTFTITFGTQANQTITAKDTVNTNISGSANIAVGAAGSIALDHFTVTAPATATAGVPFLVTVTAMTSTSTVATGYTGMVVFSSTDPLALTPIAGTPTLTGASAPSWSPSSPSR
jgi:hypothetical protein